MSILYHLIEECVVKFKLHCLYHEIFNANDLRLKNRTIPYKNLMYFFNRMLLVATTDAVALFIPFGIVSKSMQLKLLYSKIFNELGKRMREKA